jgi:signal transduction histidine kinase
LALVALATTAGWVIGLTVVFNVLLVAQLHHQADNLLRTRAEAVLATVSVAPSGGIRVREPANDAALDAGVWVYEGSRAIDRPPGAAALQRAADGMTSGGRRFSEVGGPSGVRLYAVPVRHAGVRVGTVVAATSLAPYRRTSDSALIGSVVVGLLLIAGAYVATRSLVKVALIPVREMAEQAATWSAHDVGQRFGDAPRSTELADLAASLDSVLDRIGAVLRHEQQLAGEISHELRTPLALLAAETDLLRAAPRSVEEREQAYLVIAETIDRMAALLDTLLAQAAQVVTEAPGRCTVEPVVAHELEAARSSGLRAEVAVTAGLEAGVTHEVLSRILAPIVGNATRYARHTIGVRAERRGDTVRITVSDDGPGIPAAFRERIFEPGQRADPADGHPGAGLGLALARRLARAAGGEIRLGDDAGRATFLVTLPPA